VTSTEKNKMTLIYTASGYHRGGNNSSHRRSNPIGCSSDYVIKDPGKNVENIGTYGSSPHNNVLVERMKKINISFSLDDIHTTTEEKQPRSISCIIDNNQLKQDQNKIMQGPRSILKKSCSADSASIAVLRESLLETRCLSISLSDSNLSQIDGPTEVEEPKTPTKNVTFADDNNLSLVKIHNFEPSNDNLEQWQFNTFQRQTCFKTDRLSGNQTMLLQGSKHKLIRKPNELLLCFKEPCDNQDFQERFKYKCVALERCATRDRTITGIIIVKNIEFHKYVAVRYTVDGWKTSNEVEACYVPNSNDGETDRFSFTLALPKNYKEMEFAVCYKTGASEYWDNNYNRNYKVKDALSPL